MLPGAFSSPRNSEAEGDPNVARATRQIRYTTVGALSFAILAMLIGVIATTGSAWGSALVLSIALVGSGSIVGLLFSMPKALASGGSASGDPPPPASGQAEDRAPRLYALNTNLEQVSDWLTKIIVGVGLVEARRISDLVWSAAKTLGTDMHGQQASLSADDGAVLAAGMLVGFPVFGFLIAFFAVRLYVARAMYLADSTILGIKIPQSVKQSVERGWSAYSSVPADLAKAEGRAAVAPAVGVDQALQPRLDKLQSVSDLVTRGRAALLKGRTTEAAGAFILAIEKGSTDPALFLDYARTFMDDKPVPWSRIVDQLQNALANITPSTPVEIRQQIHWELMNAYLYLPPPNGFMAAMRLGEGYVATSDGRNDPYAFVYLAAAHGEAYRFLKRSAPELAGAEVPIVREQIRRALRLAATEGMEDGIRRWLLALATNDSDDPDADNDLRTVVEDHPEILRQLERGEVDDDRPEGGP